MPSVPTVPTRPCARARGLAGRRRGGVPEASGGCPGGVRELAAGPSDGGALKDRGPLLITISPNVGGKTFFLKSLGEKDILDVAIDNA